MNDFTKDAQIAQKYFAENPKATKLSHKQPNNTPIHNSVLKVKTGKGKHKLLVLPREKNYIGAGGNGYLFYGWLFPNTVEQDSKGEQIAVKVTSSGGVFKEEFKSSFYLYTEENFKNTVGQDALSLVNQALSYSKQTAELNFTTISNYFPFDELVKIYSKVGTKCATLSQLGITKRALTNLGVCKGYQSRKHNDTKPLKHYCQAQELYNPPENLREHYSSFRAKNKHYMAAEYNPGIDLDTYIYNNILSDPEKINRHEFADKIIRQVQKYHQRKIVHADLKLENIIFDSATGNMRLIDLDYCSILPKNASNRDYIFRTVESGEDIFIASCGTYEANLPWDLERPKTFSFAAPETIFGFYGLASDIYSLGVIFHLIFEMHSDFIHKMMASNPLERPSIEEVLKHIESENYTMVPIKETQMYQGYLANQEQTSSNTSMIANAPSRDSISNNSQDLNLDCLEDSKELDLSKQSPIEPEPQAKKHKRPGILSRLCCLTI